MAHNFTILEESEQALKHLKKAERIYNSDVWFRWRYNLRLQTELSSYLIKRSDLKLADAHATALLESAEKTLSHKYIALAQKLLGDIAILEDRVEAGEKHFEKALQILNKYHCPTIEWKILKAAADLEKRLKNNSAADEYRGKAKSVVQSLAETVTDEKLRKIFLSSKAVREL